MVIMGGGNIIGKSSNQTKTTDSGVQKSLDNRVDGDPPFVLLFCWDQLSTIFLGPAGVGKNHLANVNSIALSAYWQRAHGICDAAPKFRSGNALDFFGPNPGLSLFLQGSMTAICQLRQW